jgi:hypothetical protein
MEEGNRSEYPTRQWESFFFGNWLEEPRIVSNSKQSKYSILIFLHRLQLRVQAKRSRAKQSEACHAVKGFWINSINFLQNPPGVHLCIWPYIYWSEILVP